MAAAAAWVLAAASPAAGEPVRRCEWWLRAVHVTTAWGKARGAGVTVAVLDTGVDPAAPDLRGSVITGADFTGSGRRGAGAFWGVHGTAVASLIAGHGHGPGDAEGVEGVAPLAKILSVRVVLERTDPLENNHALASQQRAAIASGIRYAVSHGAQVIALPLDPGQPTVAYPAAPAAAGGSTAEKAATAYAAARGVVLVGPAGDTGNGADGINYPAAYQSVVSVGAVGRTFARSPFSSRRPYVTLTAPGEDIVAAVPGAGYTSFSSTSAASAIIAGIAALIESRFPALTATQVKDALIHSTAAHVAGGRMAGSGFGTADAAAALRSAAEMAGAGSARTSPRKRPSPTRAARPAIPPSRHPLGPTLQSTGILIFVIFLIVLLAVSLIAIGRMPASPARTPEGHPDEYAHMAPLPTPARRQPARVAASSPAPGDMASAGEKSGRTGGPPWGPAPKPEGPPPPWAQSPRK